MTATPGQAADAPFRWEGTMAEFDAEVHRRWIESSQQLGLDHGMPNAAAALAAQEPHAAPELAAAMRDAHERQRLELLQAQGEAAETAAELSRIKARHAAVLGKFTSNGSGYTARMSGTVLARCYAHANLPVRDDLSHLAGQ